MKTIIEGCRVSLYTPLQWGLRDSIKKELEIMHAMWSHLYKKRIYTEPEREKTARSDFTGIAHLWKQAHTHTPTEQGAGTEMEEDFHCCIIGTS